MTSKRRPSQPLQAFDDAGTTLPEVLQFMRLLWAIVHQLQKRSKRMTAELGVTGPQRLVLRVIGHADAAVTARALAVIAGHLEAPTNGLRRRTPRRPDGSVRRSRRHA